MTRKWQNGYVSNYVFEVLFSGPLLSTLRMLWAELSIRKILHVKPTVLQLMQPEMLDMATIEVFLWFIVLEAAKYHFGCLISTNSLLSMKFAGQW